MIDQIKTHVRASEGELDTMHRLVALLLSNELDRANLRAEMNPNDPSYAISPQLISQALKFLKDNGVSAPAGSKVVEDLAAQLTDLDLDAEILSGMTPN
ncbi:hypothetical protein A4249_07495 [Brevundimonas sp. GW460-12-10-14-LB2]|jgi:hypothetical protein|uniref:hypothetical protein n=1 Tax=Brevundimonas TaxID=41275 RepID=UPI0007BCB67D|nr:MULTISPECIES: hypothetical protein [Brevundimonas]ANC53517.1 hypothetical protein A4249_07495 [Brevundimonas sp. GW460-12-10-14-LB2]MEA3474617.1 hypothetical protein [Pseudomonadota bacterium]